MGLGKTLQTIALIWTLLKQGPHGKPAARRALILAPCSLVKNWEAEFRKWLGQERITTWAADSSAKLGEYAKQRSPPPVLIMSYELFTRCFDMLLLEVEDAAEEGRKRPKVRFDLIVCDEGHRLKNSSIKASQCLASLPDADMRVVLTGTPLQNDLREFHAIVNVVCPGALGPWSKFAKAFEEPIVRSKQPGATPEDVREGMEKTEELAAITGQFMLRRTQDVISRYLPPKTEYVLFCPMSAMQAYVFDSVCGGGGGSLGFMDLDTQCILSM